MGDLTYAAVVIAFIWAGIFFYLFGLDRRLRRLERHIPEDPVEERNQQDVSEIEESITGSSEEDAG